MERIPKGIYTQEFREQAMRLHEVDGLTKPEVAKRLSLPAGTLKNWVYAARRGKLGEVGKNQKLLGQFDMTASMSRKGDCWDNAPMESCWGTLKNELVDHRRYRTRAQAIQGITEYIEIFYNRQRKQARLGYLSPAAFTQRYYANQLAA